MVGESELNHICDDRSVLKLYSSLSLDIQDKIAYTGRLMVNLTYVGVCVVDIH